MLCGRLLKLYSLFAALALCTAVPAFAADESLGSLDVGTWADNPRYLTFGNYNGHALKWRILEVKDSDPEFNGKKTAFLLLDDLLRDSDGAIMKVTFNNLTYNNSFPVSSISKWLNDDGNDTDDGMNGFTFSAGLGAYQEGILNTGYGPDNPWRYSWQDGPTEAFSKVFLLGADEATNPKYFTDGNLKFDSHNYGANVDRGAESDYWLRSPGPFDISSAVALADGQVGVYGFVVDYSELAVRPALKIDTASSVFTSASVPVSYP
jgi:hypothetical protein